MLLILLWRLFGLQLLSFVLQFWGLWCCLLLFNLLLEELWLLVSFEIAQFIVLLIFILLILLQRLIFNLTACCSKSTMSMACRTLKFGCCSTSLVYIKWWTLFTLKELPCFINWSVCRILWTMIFLTKFRHNNLINLRVSFFVGIIAWRRLVVKNRIFLSINYLATTMGILRYTLDRHILQVIVWMLLMISCFFFLFMRVLNVGENMRTLFGQGWRIILLLDFSIISI